LLTVPNALTALRIALTPVIVFTMLAEDWRRAFWFVMAAGLTDAIDGRIARRFHLESRLGAYLDPIADKLLLSSLFLCFWLRGRVPGWLVALIAGRDVLILSMVSFALVFTSFRNFPPSVWGKLNTALQILLALVLIVAAAFPGTESPLLIKGMTWLTGISTAWSGVHYTGRGIRMMIMRHRFMAADRRGARG
jgi:cardiolipin synthase